MAIQETNITLALQKTFLSYSTDVWVPLITKTEDQGNVMFLGEKKSSTKKPHQKLMPHRHLIISL